MQIRSQQSRTGATFAETRFATGAASACALWLVLVTPTVAEVIIYEGIDPGVEHNDPHPNSDATAAEFDAAAAALGAINLIDFEKAPVGMFESLEVAPGVTVTLRFMDARYGGIRDVPGTPQSGYNTTINGEKYLGFDALVPNAVAEFEFETPVQAFGAYLTAVGTAKGPIFIEFDDGSVQSLRVVGHTSGGCMFFGFTDQGKEIRAITFIQRDDDEDVFGIDDVRYVYPPCTGKEKLLRVKCNENGRDFLIRGKIKKCRGHTEHTVQLLDSDGGILYEHPVTTNGNGKAKFNFTYPDPGYYQVRLAPCGVVNSVTCGEPRKPPPPKRDAVYWQPPGYRSWAHPKPWTLYVGGGGGGQPGFDKVEFSGEYTEAAIDLEIPGRGFGFSLVRTYRSSICGLTLMGYNWAMSYDLYLEEMGDDLLFHDGTGRRDSFEKQRDGTWTRPGYLRVIEQEREIYTMTFADQTVWTFQNVGGTPENVYKITSMKDRNDNEMKFRYYNYGLLKAVRDTLYNPSSGRGEIRFHYTEPTNAGLLDHVIDYTRRVIQYTHDHNQDLITARSPIVEPTDDYRFPAEGHTFPEGKEVHYTYSSGYPDPALNHNLLTITDAKGNTYLQNTFDDQNKGELSYDSVIRQIRGVGQGAGQYEYEYLEVSPQGNNGAVTKTITSNPLGQVTESYFDDRGRMVKFDQHADKVYTTEHDWNDDSLPTAVRLPDNFSGHGAGSRIVYTYDQDNPDRRLQGNRLTVRRIAGWRGGNQSKITESFTYEPGYGGCCAYEFATLAQDGRGNSTVYKYEQGGKGNLKETTRRDQSVETFDYNDYGQLTTHVHPSNGTNERIDRFIYHDDSDHQYGYLESQIIDDDNDEPRHDGLQLTTVYEYDRVGNPTKIKAPKHKSDPENYTTEYQVNQLNQLLLQISRKPFLHEIETYYDENNNVRRRDIQNVDEEGNLVQSNPYISTEYSYDELNCLTQTREEVDPGHEIATEYDYDLLRNLVLTKYGEATNGNQQSNTVTTVYDRRNLVYRTILAEGDHKFESTSEFEYDWNGNLTKTKALDDQNPDEPHITRYEYDGFQRLTQVTDPESNITRQQYDANSNLVNSKILGELVQGRSGQNVLLYETTNTYDDMDRTEKVEVAHFDLNSGDNIGDGMSTTRFRYHPNSQTYYVTDDNGKRTIFYYDSASRKRRVTDPKNSTITYTYDHNSNVISTTELDRADIGQDESFTTTMTYDTLDRLIAVTDNDQKTTRYLYNSRHLNTVKIDALGRKTLHNYDGRNRLLKTIRDMNGDGEEDPGDIITTQLYDESHRLIARIDDKGLTTRFAFDPVGRQVAIKKADSTIHQIGSNINWPDGADRPKLKKFRSGYDDHHNIITATDANQTITDNSYDKLNRLADRSVVVDPESGVADTTRCEIFRYNGLSQVVYAENTAALVKREYDSLGNVLRETLTVGMGPNEVISTVSSTFDGESNKLSCTYPGLREMQFSYDALNQVKTISEQPDVPIAAYEYVGRRVRQRRFNNNTQVDYVHDDLRRIIETTHTPQGGGPAFDQRSYAWDAVHNKTQRRDLRPGGPQLTHDYFYDPINRLTITEVTDNQRQLRYTSYDLDSVGNRKQVGGSGTPDPGYYTMDDYWPVPADEQVQQYTTTPFDSRVYDENGNLIAAPQGLREMAYDYANQMVSFSDAPAEVGTSYAYDVFRRRVRKVVNTGGGQELTNYFYDGRRVIEEQDVDGNTLATYVYAGDYIDAVQQMQRRGTDYYYHTDDMFNVMAITDDGGNLVERYEYGDCGQPEFYDESGTPIPQSAISNPYLFTGRRFDDESGLYYYRTRYLDPRAGRFTTEDTIGIWGDLTNIGNGYTYVGNNPWTLPDPLGLGWWTSFWTGAAKVVTEPYHQIQDVTKLVGAKLMDIPQDCIELNSVVGKTQERRIDEGQSATEASLRAGGETVANTLSLGLWGLARAHVELGQLYVNGEITREEYEAALWEVAGGLSASVAVAAIRSRTSGTARTWNGKHPRGFERGSKSWNAYLKKTKGTYKGKGWQKRASQDWRNKIENEAAWPPREPALTTPGSESAMPQSGADNSSQPGDRCETPSTSSTARGGTAPRTGPRGSLNEWGGSTAGISPPCK